MLQDRPSTYAIGDIHGEVTLLHNLLAQLPFQPEDTLVFLGDYLDRGEDALATILALRDLRQAHKKSVFLRGNHEDAWLAYWDGARFSRPPDMDGAQELWDLHNGHLPFVIGDWLEETQITYENEYAYYVHAGLLPGKNASLTSDFYKMWGSPGFLPSDYDWGKPVVFGHWRMSQPLIQPNKIGIDTGAYRSGILTAVRLPDRHIFQATR